MISWLAFAVLVTVAFWRIQRATTRWAKAPPGPSCLPVIGNLHQFPLKDFHLKFQKWADQYGPLLCLKTGSQNFMLINSPAVVKDLIEKRGALYAARPDWFIREFNGNMNIAFRNNDDVWRRMRKTYHVRLNVTVSNRYIPYQTFDSLQLLNDMLDSPDDFSRHIQRYTTSVASTVLYGWRTPSANKGYVRDLIQWMDKTSEAANLQLADFWLFLRPLYRLIPISLSSYKSKLADVREIEHRLFYTLLNDAKANIAAGKVYPSFIRDMLLDRKQDETEGLSEEEIAQQAGHGFGAGSDTQWNTLLGLVKGLILYPEAQRRAHEEIDRVIGAERMPVWEDRAQLPWVRACIDEALRWMPTTLSAAVPHSLLQDDEYNGWTIPARSVMMMNVWALNNSVARGKDPRAFDPSRHSEEATKNENYGIDADSAKRGHFTFGAGRRVCPGFHVAQRGLFIAASRLLWAFNFERACDEAGVPIPIEQDALTEGLIVRPVPYPCAIKPRDEKKVEMIREAWREASASLDADGNYLEDFFSRVAVKPTVA
ncbi:hypothetical protein BDV06DRAFT_205916 [Aspergillus oleicola]